MREKGIKKAKKGTKTLMSLNQTVATLDTQLIKGYSKDNIHSKEVRHILAQHSCLFNIHFLNMKQKHKVLGGQQKGSVTNFIFTYSSPPGSCADIRSLSS